MRCILAQLKTILILKTTHEMGIFNSRRPRVEPPESWSSHPAHVKAWTSSNGPFREESSPLWSRDVRTRLHREDACGVYFWYLSPLFEKYIIFCKGETKRTYSHLAGVSSFRRCISSKYFFSSAVLRDYRLNYSAFSNLFPILSIFCN